MMIGLGNDLIQSFEEEFGQIETGIVVSRNPIVQIVRYETSPTDVVYISTLGMSKLEKTPRFEWYMEFLPSFSSDHAASLLSHYASMYIQNEIEPPKRGSYIVFDEKIKGGIEKRKACGVYFTHPFFRSTSLMRNLSKKGIILVWVIPIVPSELQILTTHGWNELESYWDTNDINLHSIDRN